MASNPQTQDDWTIHAINIHGVFFERWCQQAISDTEGWILKTTNYPVEYPSPNGPIRGRESTLDIRAESNIQNGRVTLLIECKKNNPEFINWVFFRKFPYPAKGSLVVTRLENVPRAAPSTGWTVNNALLDIESPFVIADEARETRGDYLSYKDSGRKTKTANAAITEAAYQVALATQAITTEDTSFTERLGSAHPTPTMPWQAQSLFPVIVTTARLYVCELRASDVDSRTGEVEYNKAQLKEYPELVYEYPLPRHLQAKPADLVGALTRGSIERFMRMHILVVNSRQFKEFLKSF